MRLVVSIILDQLGSNTLDRYWDALPDDGALERVASRGTFEHDVVYPYAGTYTAPGHSTIYTGVYPRQHHIVANAVYDRRRGKEVPIVDDGRHAVFGDPDAHASPTALAAETVTDLLERDTGGAAKTASISIKDRAAVLPGGHHPDLVLWYDTAIGKYTTSTYYTSALPAWVIAWNAAHPVQALLVPWVASDPRLLARYAGRDDAPGEGNWLGLGTTFPHDPARSSEPLSAIRATPQSSEHLLDLAWKVVQQLDMGADDIPDLLCVSVSSTDYVGHVYGPGSWEYLDNLIRVDRALGRFLDRLASRTSVAVLITSDHGAAPLPEDVTGEPAGRLEPDELVAAVEKNLDRKVGRGHWVAAFAQPFIYLTDWARDPHRRDRAVKVAIETLQSMKGVAAAFDARALAAPGAHDASTLEHAAALSTPPDTDGDIFVVPARHFVVDEGMPKGTGTSHGTPWDYDTHVPVLFFGPGVAHQSTDAPLAMARTASTIAALLGIAPPTPAAPLPGAPDVSARAPRPAGDSTSAAVGARQARQPGTVTP